MSNTDSQLYDYFCGGEDFRVFLDDTINSPTTTTEDPCMSSTVTMTAATPPPTTATTHVRSTGGSQRQEGSCTCNHGNRVESVTMATIVGVVGLLNVVFHLVQSYIRWSWNTTLMIILTWNQLNLRNISISVKNKYMCLHWPITSVYIGGLWKAYQCLVRLQN